MGKELFKNIPSKVGDLVKDVRNGRIGLPDLQRPFVWRDNKVRELFDSMLKGYPIGYIMLWESPVDYESKKSAIGDNSKTYEEPKELVIDGQQRLTALVAAMYAVKVKDKNFADREIKISYNPLTREFAVWSQAYEKDTEWISRISDVFLAKEDNSISSLRRHFIKEANEGRGKKELPLLTDEEEDRIEDNINALLNLSDYSLPTLEISYTADEEDVADIFVRVNSGGQSLTENNFIQTLISVYENETSNKINAFAAASRVPAANTSYNTLLAIEPSHLIRMAVGVGFKRARLRYAYMLLRGKNLETGKFSDEVRHENLQIFKGALDKVMNLNNWHSFINIVAEAGYISDKLIASSNAIVFSYVLYLIAKYDYKLDAAQLKKCTSKWFFMSTITYFYTGSTESEVEKQFADLRDVHIIEAALRSANITENSLRTYWGENLYTFVNTSNVFAPLVEALQKTHSGTMDVRSIVVCAANAFESFLADFAIRKGVSLSGRNGILQKRDALSAHISKKHRGMIEFVGQVRNAADHGADPDENNQVWTISNETARIYPCIIAALIKAIFSRDATGSIEV